jgi:hypothetical protein
MTNKTKTKFQWRYARNSDELIGLLDRGWTAGPRDRRNDLWPMRKPLIAGKLPDLPDGWRWVNQYGYLVAKLPVSTDIREVDIGSNAETHIFFRQGGRTAIASLEGMTKALASESSKHKFVGPRECIMVVKWGNGMGRVAVIDDDADVAAEDLRVVAAVLEVWKKYGSMSVDMCPSDGIS